MEAEVNSIGSFVRLTENQEWAAIVERAMLNGWRWEDIQNLWGPIYPWSVFISLLLLAGILYCALRIWQIRRIEYHQFHRESHPIEAEDKPRTQLRWNRVMEHASSKEEHEWRLAILEADIMLNELLDVRGYKGETMADKMKQVVRADFNTIDDAWEAHKVRNKVAHEGSQTPLSEQEKNRVIGLYARVFREFGFIE